VTDIPAAPVRVAFLHADDLTEEQTAALEWCRGIADRVELRSPADPAASGLSSDEFDVVWWHADRPAEDATPMATPIREFVAEGGGLLLTQYALSAVADLGIDPIPPDDVAVGTPTETTGLYLKALFADHPAFEGFDTDDGRLHICDAGERSVAAYDAVLPERGDVLASAMRGESPAVDRKIAVKWAIGDGHVVGVGDGLDFRDRGGIATTRDHDRLVRNLLTVLGGERFPPFTDRPGTAEGMATLRRRVDARDAREGTHGDQPNHRPAYHVSPPAGWLNDPNGLIEHEGTYHVFYQYNPGGPMHGTVHWGHATSEDLLHWTDQPVALAPDPDGPDRDGCWSGCAVVADDGTPTLLYTGGVGRTQLTCLATTTDPALRDWTKHPENPIIEATPSDPPLLGTENWEAEFRDHCVWQTGGTWYQLIGSGVEAPTAGGAALLYRSQDLRNWEYVGPLLVGDWDGAGHMWECPELLDFGEKQLLHVSNYSEVQYYLGEADIGGSSPSFARDEMGVLDYGDFYAPQSMDLGARYLTWGWLVEARSVEAQWEAGWSGMLSLPRELDVGADGRLRQRPAPELAGLREAETDDLTALLAAGERRELAAEGTACELEIEIDLGSPAFDGEGPGGDGDAERGAFVLSVLESPGRTEATEIRYTGEALIVDRERSSLDPRADAEPQRLPIAAADGTLSLRVFVDGSVVELFADERDCLTSRVYPTRDDAIGVALEARGGDVTLDCTAWELASADESAE